MKLYKIVLGGSWNYGNVDCCVSLRDQINNNYWHGDIGFRLKLNNNDIV